MGFRFIFLFIEFVSIVGISRGICSELNADVESYFLFKIKCFGFFMVELKLFILKAEQSQCFLFHSIALLLQN